MSHDTKFPKKGGTANCLCALAVVLFVCTAGSALAASQTRTSAFDYDSASGLLTKEIVEPGSSDLCLVTTYSYDTWGNKTGTTTRNCNGSAGSVPAYNSEAAAPAAGNAAVFAPRSGSVAYSADGRFPVTGTNALGQSDTKVYDGTLGVVTQMTGPNGLSTYWKYDALGRQVLEKRADGNGTAWAYQYCSSIVVNGVAGTDTCPTIAGAAGAYTVKATPVKAPVDIAAGTHGGANGPYTKSYHDSLGRVIRVEAQAWDGSTLRLVYQDTEYNSLGRIVRSSQPYFAGSTTVQWVVTDYDWIGRALRVTQPDGSKSTSTYEGLTIRVTDNLGRVTTQTRNVADQLVQITDPHGKTLRKTYDPYGNLLTTTDSLGNVTRLTYDARGRKTELVDPDMGRWTYGYNALGELTKQTDAKSQVTQMAYDLLGRLTSKTEPSLNTSWYYDKYQDGSACNKGTGKLCETVAANGYRRKHFYDSLGRAYQTTTTLGTSSYTSSVSFTADGLTDTVTYPGGALSLKHQYVSLGFLQKVVNAASPATVYWTATGVDAQGRITDQLYGNNVATTNIYDAQTGRLRNTLAGAGYSVQNVAYTYDTVGNLKTRNDSITGVNASYGYDALNRLTTETRQGGGLPSAQTITWAYNDIGNITSRSDVGTYAYNPSGSTGVRPHAVTGVTGSVNGQANPSYGYDANGNLATVTVGGATLRSVVWNSHNKVDSVSQTVAGNTNKLEFVYDSEGDRVREVFSKNGAVQRTTTYLNAGAGLVYEEETAAGVTKKKHYLDAAGGTIGVLTLTGSTWTTQYWHKDHLGSPMVITNEAGAVVERLAYEPFGKRRNANGVTDAGGTLTAASTRRGFTGHEHDDEVGLVNMNGRVFDQAIGRFLSADPTLQAPTYMQSYNRYAYMWNSPLNGTDPSGYSNVFKDLMDHGDRAVVRSLALGGDFPNAYLSRELLTGKYGYQTKSLALAVASAYFCSGGGKEGVAACIGVGQAILGKAYGMSDHEAMKAGALAAATSYAMGQVGDWTTGADGSMSLGQKAANIAGHAAVGCASVAAGGGECRDGALSGGFGAAYSNFGPELFDANDLVGRTMEHAVVGGAASVLGGGKFANGAITAAFGYLFNYWRHRVLTGRGHHIIPNEVVSKLGITSPDALEVFDSINARIPVEQHNGARPSPNTVSHAQYNKLALTEAEQYMKANNIDPAKMTTQQAKNMVHHFKTAASAAIRQFNMVQYSRALQQAMRRAWYRTPVKTE